MNDQDPTSPQNGIDFPEVDHPSTGDMRDEILIIVIDALNKQGYSNIDRDSIRTKQTHRKAVLDMLRDCRPMPVVRNLIEEIESYPTQT